MTALRQRIKNALDEARILVLGAQVLLGFQYRAFFETGYARLPALDRGLELAALFLLVGVLGLLFLVPARHRLVEHGGDTTAFHRFVMRVMRATLVPFACGLAADVFVAADVVLGRAGGLALGGGALVAALALWYGMFLHPRRGESRREEEEEDRMEHTPLEQRVVQVLTEARVVLPGAQAMLGFQLAMVLTDPFARLPAAAKLVHLVALGCVTLATVVLMAPAAYHRIVESGHDTERFHSFASRMVLLALALLAPAFAGDVYVVLRRTAMPRAAPIVSAALLALCYAAWFGGMLVLRSRRRA